MRFLLAMLATLTCLAAGLLFAVGAQATTTPGDRALNWAEAHATGHPFAFGGTAEAIRPNGADGGAVPGFMLGAGMGYRF